MALCVSHFQRPCGNCDPVMVQEIDDEDAKWLENNAILISMEDIGSSFVLYADIGLRVDDDPCEDPDEILVLAHGKSSRETFKKLRKECQKALKIRKVFYN